MAQNLQQTISLIFEGVDNTGQAIGGVLKGLDSVSSSTQQAVAPLANFTTSILKTEAALAGAGAALAVFSASVAQDFERSFREITTLIDAPTESLQDFRANILEYAQSSTDGLDEITQAIYSTISAGVAWEDSIKAVEAAQRLGLAGNASLNEGLEALIPTLNAYGAGMEEAERFSDILFTTVKNGRTTLPELASTLSNVTAIAATAGISFEEISAAIATLTAAGAPTAQAVDSIRAAITAYLKPSSEAASLAKELGIEFNASALSSKGLGGALQEAAAATGGSAEKMAILFGRVQALSGALTITGTGSEKFAASLSSAENALGATAAAGAKFAGTLDTGADALTVLLVKLGTPLLTAFVNSKAALTDMTNAIAEQIGAGGKLQVFVDLIQAFGERIEQVLVDVARNLPAALESADLSGFLRGIDQVADAVARLFDGVDITTVDGLRTAIEKVGTGFEKLGIFTGAAIDQIKPMLSLAADLANTIIEADGSLIAWVGTLGGVAVAANTVLPVINSLALGVLAFGGPAGALTKAGTALAGFGVAAKATGTALAAFATTTAGVVAAGAGLGYWLGKNLNDMYRFSDSVVDAVASLSGLDDEFENAIGPMRVTAETLGIVRKSAETVGLGFEEAGRALGKYELENAAVIKTLDIQTETNDRLTASFAEQGKIYDITTGQVRDFAGAVYDYATAQEVATAELEAGKRVIAQYTDESGKLVKVYEDIGGSAKEAKASLGELLTQSLDSAGAFNEFAEATGVAKDKILEFAKDIKVAEITAKADIDIADIESKTEIATAQIATLEKIAVAKVELNIAEVQANAEIASSLIAGISDVAAGTNENIRTVIEAIAGLDEADKLAFGKAQTFKQQLKLENERIDRSLELQERLTTAQIAYYQASTKRLRTGDALITVRGEGLEPHIKAIMFEILQEIQIEVNQQQAGFLLGLPAAA